MPVECHAFDAGETRITVTVSIGIAMAPIDGADFDIKIYRRANSAPRCITYTLSMSNG